MTNQNAGIGSQHESIFANEVKKNPQTIADIVKALTSDMPTRGLRIKDVKVVGQYGKKTDVSIITTGGHNFGVNIKSFKGTGFNQVTRMKIDNFVNQFKISENIRNVLKKLTIEKAKKINQKWITNDYTNMIIQEIQPKALEIIRYSLLGEDLPKLFVLIKSDEKIIWIYKMEHLLDYLKSSIDVKVTSRGILELNECFTIQKKGGNGQHEKFEKEDLRHGGNNIQVKMKTGLLSSRLNPISTLRYGYVASIDI